LTSSNLLLPRKTVNMSLTSNVTALRLLGMHTIKLTVVEAVPGCQIWR
jgi:hypothetical protein